MTEQRGRAWRLVRWGLLGLFALEAPRWVSWALGDLAVKMIVGLAMLAPYGVLMPVLGAWRAEMVLGALVLSHWLLGALTHRPDRATAPPPSS